MLKLISLLIMFIILGLTDIKTKKINIIWLAFFGILGISEKIYLGENIAEALLAGVLTWIILYIISIITREKIGKGDALLFGITGIYLNIFDNISLLFYSFLLVGVFSLIMLVLKKADRKTEIPFLPFVGISYLLMQLNIV
ncbi:leader peptidase (prepilin peptidase) / N-methyltransferase/leader peptidase (prepilin peptidase) / N-methyltransferase [Acetitomaculum ruminis DSM 5522]|uniref:Leader peptidase (Prepilin peptidase) / N-methyltransferase/leader peptidase (Prepilin peptidase) / N-methyltransferase n=1 Tax=Acetitomaculum ruminis DSM 5522 TaxID=1120918 RepID=A0A1I0YAT2_9FIRM|nr:prepilin peptidase [Acetitomaculum ruminis]SFB09866.1 leader peptidase (prepilin peptidase) / N-methyltransferase/leader peptidase (prepilin peptidase) / N-methyltransferase [Acetitomaculum ruminis DSM 5522]